MEPFRNKRGRLSRASRPQALLPAHERVRWRWGFSALGYTGGFIQAGVGFLILAMTTMAGLDLVRGNAVKVLIVFVFTSVVLGIFIWHGKVHWPMGLVLAAGNVLGGLLGVRLTVLMGHVWVRGVVTMAVIVFAVRLWFEG